MLSLFNGREHLAPLPQSIDIIRSLIGGTLSILILILLSKFTHNLFIMAPFGANPLVILLTANTIQYHWSFLFFPVLLGSIALVMVAWLVNNLKSEQKWPVYGLAFIHSKKNIE